MSLWSILRDSIRNGKGVVIIGPAGSGKVTVAKNLLSDAPYEEVIPVFIKVDLEEGSPYLNDLVSKVEYPAVPILIVRTKEEVSITSFVDELEDSVIRNISEKCRIEKDVLLKHFHIVTCPGKFVSLV